MPTYKQKVRFEREFVIEAKDASEASQKLEEQIDDVEMDADVRCEGFYEFEDEPVPCPDCEDGRDSEDKICSRCDGDGVIPFQADEG
jgi:hypothetical protein